MARPPKFGVMTSQKRGLETRRPVSVGSALSVLRGRVRESVRYLMSHFNAYLISHGFAILFGIMPYQVRITNTPITEEKPVTKVEKAIAFFRKLSLSGIISNVIWMYLYLFQILVRPLSIKGFKKNNQIQYLVSTGKPWKSMFAMQNFSVNLLNTINLVYVWYRYYHLPNLVDQLNKIDQDLVKERILDNGSHGRLINKEWALIGGTNLVTFLCYSLKLFFNRRVFYSMDRSYSPHLILLQIFCYTKSSAAISMFFALFIKLRLRHKAINEKLKLIFERVQEIPAEAKIKTISKRLSVGSENEGKGRQTKDEITRIEYQLRRINQLYYELVVKQEEIMDMFKIDLLVGMAAFSVGLCVDIFLILYKIMYSATPWSGLFSLWQAILIWNLYLTFNAGDYLYSEARETRTILACANRSSFPDLIKNEIRCFLLRIKYKLPTISVFSMYDLNFSTIPSLVTGMASYVVIVLQYEWIRDIDQIRHRTP